MFKDEFQYPEDRGEIYGDISEEEAHFYFTLLDFEELVNKYGSQFVVSRMRNECFEKLSDWFYSIGNGSGELPYLLKKKC